MNLAEIRKLIDTSNFVEALSQIDRLVTQVSECPYLWNLRGDLIQLLDTKDGPPLGEAAESYANALKLNPNDLEALEGLAHFYDAVDRKPIEARKYAKAYLEKSKKAVIAMEQILAENA